MNHDSLDLRYWSRDEFVTGTNTPIDWFPHMSLRLLVLLDSFRHRWGDACIVSPHPRALGRYDGDSYGQHNIDRYGEVRAIDFFPDGMDGAALTHKAVSIARSCGFTGIGIYPNWQPRPGLHVDVRVDEAPGHPATWGGVDGENGQVYVGLQQALEVMGR